MQSIPRGSNYKDVAAMLDELTIEGKEESFIVLQRGSNDVTCKRSTTNNHDNITLFLFVQDVFLFLNVCLFVCLFVCF